jgi:biopolymer transport protein ExbB/TolQ
LAIAVIEAKLTTAYGWLIGVPALVAFIILVRGNQTQEDSSDN